MSSRDASENNIRTEKNAVHCNKIVQNACSGPLSKLEQPEKFLHYGNNGGDRCNVIGSSPAGVRAK
jgi:hypothetical protein